ncbi:MAG TPA: hypothetical protein PLE74_01010 [Candidatus Cloacimonadota bacterium]|nr:hypothetical protein [Candidatus Cloacimonadota bacterium]
MSEGMDNQMMVMPAKALKDLRKKKQDKVDELKEMTNREIADTVCMTNLEKQIEVIDVFIKRRGIT